MKIALVLFSIIGITAKAYAETSKNCGRDPTICSDQQCCVLEEEDISEGSSFRIRKNFSCKSFQGEGESCYLDSMPFDSSGMLYGDLCPCMSNLTCVPNEKATTVEYDYYNYDPDGTCKRDENELTKDLGENLSVLKIGTKNILQPGLNKIEKYLPVGKTIKVEKLQTGKFINKKVCSKKNGRKTLN